MTDTPLPNEFNDHARARLRRRVGFVAIAVFLLALLALTPPLLNVSRLRHRIAAGMSQSLGRPVHLDNVTMHLLPVPGFTLENLVVSEDPAFGNEPVIRANTVEATLRISSLWRRQVEISSVRFIEPSLNIVRNPQGRWNLEDILTQAARANAAPTAQRKAGPAPRFPYIEATGARVNLKLGDEKMPLSLTEADFALWLPSPQQWHIRLQGKPSRTDANVSDTGIVHLEGTLGRAATLAEVPLNLTADWTHAQMGEASLLLTGDDEGWRGTLEAGATLTGQLGSAKLTTDVHLTDLRRADFVPAKLLDVSAHCTANANVAAVSVTQAICTVPTGGPQPITLTAASVDLQKPDEAAAQLNITAVPLLWALDWAKLFSQRIPADLPSTGTIDGSFQRSSSPSASLTGNLHLALQPEASEDSPSGKAQAEETKTTVFSWIASATPAYPGSTATTSLQLQSTLHPGGSSQLSLTGGFDPTGYTLHLSGNATASQLQTLASRIPPLSDGLLDTLPHPTHPDDAAHELNITCTRKWGTPQTCTTAHAASPQPTKPHHHR